VTDTPSASLDVDQNLLRIYLQDHLAGSEAGLELFRRAAGANSDNDLGRFLRDELIPEVEEDRDTLVRVMERFGVGGNWAKNALAWAAEKAGRAKLNGRLTGYSPLSRVVELDSIAGAIRAKACLWDSLQATFGADPVGAGIDFEALSKRAQSQIDRVESFRPWASTEAFLRS
jgi:hypothetical protein